MRLHMEFEVRKDNETEMSNFNQMNDIMGIMGLMVSSFGGQSIRWETVDCGETNIFRIPEQEIDVEQFTQAAQASMQNFDKFAEMFGLNDTEETEQEEDE